MINEKRKQNKYKDQQRRGHRRRQELIDLKGGKCEICGYNRCRAALTFHHLDSSAKSFGIDLRACSNKRMSILLKEADKCQLLCANCHMEIHNPHLCKTTDKPDKTQLASCLLLQSDPHIIDDES